MRFLNGQDGYSLVELLLIIMVVAIIAGIAMKSLRGVNDVARTEETRQELDEIAYAIAGNPDLSSAGVRTDYGYVGDVGAMPANLDDLVTNPGAYATWQGPYIKDKLSGGGADVYFKSDAWGTAYTYTGGSTVASTGGPSTMTRQIANSTAELLSNKVAVTITDINGTPPGTVYKDSLKFLLTYPDGAGGSTLTNLSPAADGFIEVSSIPIGLHDLSIVYLPTNDTLRRKVNVDPGRDYYAEVHLFADIWSPTGGGGGGGGSPEILRPNGSGTGSIFTGTGCGAVWQCVSEVTADDDASYVASSGGSWDNETYAMDNSSVGTGTIDSVVIFFRGKDFRARNALRTGGTLYESTDIWLTASYVEYSLTYINNPKSGSAWTWAEVDAMEVGVTLKETARVTQIWAEVHYTP